MHECRSCETTRCSACDPHVVCKLDCWMGYKGVLEGTTRNSSGYCSDCAATSGVKQCRVCKEVCNFCALLHVCQDCDDHPVCSDCLALDDIDNCPGCGAVTDCRNFREMEEPDFDAMTYWFHKLHVPNPRGHWADRHDIDEEDAYDESDSD